MQDAWDSAAILHYCKRCTSWRPLYNFYADALLCQDCVHGHRKIGGHEGSRTYALTPKAKTYLWNLRRQERTSAA